MKCVLASLKRFIRRQPLLYFTLFGWKPSVRKLRGHRDSELILEAFPRSANTTSMYALYYAQGVDTRLLLRDYIDFAKVAVDLCEQVVVVSFNDVIKSGMGRVVQKLNQKYGTRFREPDGSVEEQAWVKDQIRNWDRLYSGGDEEKLSFPTEAKRKKAAGVKEQIREASDLLEQAEELYRMAVEKGEAL
jgi:hypothetical protein